ncbi:MAG: NADH-quinone oxidoreductase subunit A [Verrucomicrobiia bacterium]
MNDNYEIYYLLVLMLTGIGYVLGSFFVARILAPRHNDPVKEIPYECGELPYGSAWKQFNVGYYIFALLFLIFDVEVIFLFPWGVIFREFGAFALIEGGIFLLILIFGLIFAWRKGYLVWQ